MIEYVRNPVEPAALVAGAGLGLVHYEFVQDGEFIDFESAALDIYSARTTSSSSAFLLRASGGVDISLGKQFVFTTEGRYNWAGDEPIPGDFRNFNRMDLDGLQLIAGIAVRF